MSGLSSSLGGRKSLSFFPTREYVTSLYDDGKYIEVATAMSYLIKLHDDWMDGLDDEGYQTEDFGDYHDLLKQAVSDDLPAEIFEDFYTRALREENIEFFEDFLGPYGLEPDFFEKKSSRIYDLKDSILGLLFDYIFEKKHYTGKSNDFIREIIPLIIDVFSELNYSDVENAIRPSNRKVEIDRLRESADNMILFELAVILLIEYIGNVDEDQMTSASHLLFELLSYGAPEAYHELERMGAYHELERMGEDINYRNRPVMPFVRSLKENTPVRSPLKSPVRSPSRSPVRSLVRSPQKSPVRSPQKSPVRSPPKSTVRSPPKSLVRSPPKSTVRSPPKSTVRSPPKSPVRTLPKSLSKSPVRSPPKSLARSPPKSSVRSPPKSLSKSPVQSPPKSPVQSKLGSFYGGRKTLQDHPEIKMGMRHDIGSRIDEKAKNQDYEGINEILNELLRLAGYTPGIHESTLKLNQTVRSDFTKAIEFALNRAIRGSYDNWYEFNKYMIHNMDPILNIPYRREIFRTWVGPRMGIYDEKNIPDEVVFTIEVTYSSLPHIYPLSEPGRRTYILDGVRLLNSIQDKMAVLIERIDDDLIDDPEEYEAAQEKMASYIRSGYYRTAKNLYDKGIRLTDKEAEELRNLILGNDQLEFLRD